MHAPHRLMQSCTACIAHDVTGQWMQLVHGLCCFDFVADIPLSQTTLSHTGILYHQGYLYVYTTISMVYPELSILTQN
jgi:hypothetical protein